MKIGPFTLPYYGWIVLAAVSITEMLAWGGTSYAAGHFVLPLQEEFGISRAVANLAVPIMFAGAAIMAPFVGRVLDRYSIKWVLCIGGLSFSFAFLVIAHTSSLWLMVVMLAVPAAIGLSSIGVLTTGTLASRWFYRRRGMALGIGAVATSGGGIFVAPVLLFLIQAYGWREALIIESIGIAIIVVLLGIFVVRNNPTEMGLENHSENLGRPPADFKPADPASSKMPWYTLLVQRDFIGVALALALVAGTNQAIVTSLIPYATQLGFTTAYTATLVPVFAIAAGLTKLIGGIMADYVNRKLIMFVSGLIMMASALVLLSSTSYSAIVTATALAGTGLGCLLPPAYAVIANSFGAPSYGRVMGWAYVFLGISAIVLPPVTGAIYDATGGYRTAFTLFAVLSALASAATLLIRKPR